MTTTFDDVYSQLLSDLQRIDTELGRDKRTSPEDQLKVPVHNLLTSLGRLRSEQINVATEHRQQRYDQVEGVRLDLAVKNGHGQLLGHIELKAPTKSANPYRPTGWTRHDKKQWKRLSNHSNLIYTNGWEWTLLRYGSDRPLAHVRIDPDAAPAVAKTTQAELQDLLQQFLSWRPSTPSTPKGLADTLAPLTRFLRDTVIDVVTDNDPDSLDKLYNSWTADLMPGATKAQFADSFAQTFTYALLLARVESDVPAEQFDSNSITPTLRTNGHRLISSVLELMAQRQNRELVEGPVALLEATIGTVNVDKFTQKADPWLYFYEDFLAAYDEKMRKTAGVYYTPVEIVETQVRLLDDALKTRFGRPEGLGDEATSILDNATGTATYPLAVARRVLDRAASPQDAARSLAKRLFAFELLMGPYSVAHMRLTQLLEATGADLGADGVQVFLTNSLTDPGEVSGDNEQMSIWEVLEDINEETRKAGLVKNSQTPIRVILGNPPYDRGSKAKTLGAGSTQYKNIVLEETNGHPPLLEDFIEPLRARKQGGQAKNLYNSYIYFIRWAIWKACEQRPGQTGIVSYITAASYLRGPGFAGVREHMRRIFDEVWIIDLGGEGRGARQEENVFSIQTPVAIFVGVQHPTTANGTPKKNADRLRQKATIYYRRVTGTRKQKLESLGSIAAPSPRHHPGWEKLPLTEWGDKFAPSSAAALSDGLPLDNIFPWSISGAQFKRTWPIAATKEALTLRWKRLFEDGPADPELFSPDRDLTTATQKTHAVTGEPLPRLSNPTAQDSMLEPVRYGYRSFDRQWCLPDHRVGTYIRQSLWDTSSNDQLFLSTVTTTPLSKGPAITISPYVPDLHFFRGSFGAKNVHPLYRSDGVDHPNVSSELLQALEHHYGRTVSAFEVLSYVVGLLGTSAYTEIFEEELTESVPHVPFTASEELFQRVVAFGRKIIFEQSWGERGGELNEFGQPTGQRYKGRARIGEPTPSAPYPQSWSYTPDSHELLVGNGRFDHVSPEVMNFEISGLKVIDSWLDYRMARPTGKSSSGLGQIQANFWEHDTELLELLWQIEFMINAEVEGRDLLNEVFAEEKIPPTELGVPNDAERKAPPRSKRGTLPEL
ncbi:N-6 DNA methylase [Corynebacterium sp. UMB9976]|uniref:type ISP restriction/modification enzyme n=1 Tax=Corynebacterium sp. UMB9976 TaxID=3046354 RepID=UPI00254E57ED|nr:type ISP restriction/modification enzyme [Corynebacterium sp. UMB9976]MDK6302426.1 N-6 DNA methylase [Corynebacterium sp. UMB9976]